MCFPKAKRFFFLVFSTSLVDDYYVPETAMPAVVKGVEPKVDEPKDKPAARSTKQPVTRFNFELSRL